MTQTESQILQLGDRSVLCAGGFAGQVTEILFRPAQLAEEGLLTGRAKGRGEAYFLRSGDYQLVLRHFRRGGLVGKLVSDRYLFLSRDASRSWREFRLLAEMAACGLPVPRPIAASVQRQGLFYRADLLTELIPETRTLAASLKHSLSVANWSAIGACLRRFHDAGICHADLNAHNILLDRQQRVYLIDFDRGRRRTDRSWKERNLLRLKRSLEKISSQNPESSFSCEEWQQLRLGYAQNGEND
ncbi:MAG: 3-deoxy-D-manno-octulosonic acid kinase [Desulfuromonadales bacterium]|nr:3-deoxy-D-manno-octulosonic acid kinase [Desulfuromonadales bacterium]